jgi:thioredoxin 1
MIQYLASEYAGRAVVGTVDIFSNNKYAAQYDIENMPTVLYFNNGKKVGKQVGLAARSVYEKKLNSLLSD